MNVLKIIQQAATEMGIPIPVTGVSASDVQARQLFGLYNALGMELITQFDWQRAQKSYSFLTIANQAGYPLPADWQGPIDQTQWDKSNHWPIAGQATPQQWGYLTGGIISRGPRSVFRIRGGMFEVFPTPTVAGVSMTMEYISSGWCYAPSTPALLKPIADADDDQAIFPDRLCVNGVKLKFFQIKGFNTTALQKDYDTTLDNALSSDQSAPVLSLSPRPASIYLGIQNVPDGSWPTS